MRAEHRRQTNGWNTEKAKLNQDVDLFFHRPAGQSIQITFHTNEGEEGGGGGRIDLSSMAGESVAIIPNEVARFRQFSWTGTPSRIGAAWPDDSYLSLSLFLSRSLSLYITYIRMYAGVCLCVYRYTCVCVYIYKSAEVCVWVCARGAARWGWRVAGVKATTGADLNPRPGR